MSPEPGRVNRLASLQYAVEVARHGSFSAAARVHGVTQPTVSAAIADLEERLGVTLFIRTTRAVTLTPEGERIVPLAEASIHALEAVEQEAALLRQPPEQRIRLGFTPLVGATRINVLLQRFQSVLTSIDVVLLETSNEELESSLDAGTLDVAFGFGLGMSKRRGRLLVYEDRLRFVHPWKEQQPGEIDLHTAAKSRLLLTADLCGLATGIRAIFADAGLTIDAYAGRTISCETLVTWAEMGLGEAILPECHLSDSESHPLLVLEGVPVTILGEAVWRKDFLVGAAAKRFVTALSRECRAVHRGKESGLP